MIYIRVPADRNGRGKVILNHQGKMVEVDALTDEKEDLIRNTKVEVVALEDENTLLVKKTK
jgi:membrane protein implicated in regulation of membrane protease activity